MTPGVSPTPEPRGEWRSNAACIDKPVEWFFPPNGGQGRYSRGLAVCASCPVRDECRDEHTKAEAELDRVLPGLWAGAIQGGRERRRAAS